MSIIPPDGTAPFDHLKQTTPDGAEFWSARDLQAPMGYDRWERFESAIERASIAAQNSGAVAGDHFRGAAKVMETGRWGQTTVLDWHLSRYGAYLVAMNGDPRKPEIAAAQTYFAVRTREAETRPVTALPDLTTPQGVLALAERLTATARQLVEADARIKELEPKALVHDTLMAAQDGDLLVRQAAKAIGWPEKQLRHFLLDERLIYRRQATCGATQYDFYAAHAECFNAVERVVEHTWGSCAHYTLHLTPRGLAFVQMRIGKRAAEMRAAVAGGAR
jgi:DNA-damage-inducible protein D